MTCFGIHLKKTSGVNSCPPLALGQDRHTLWPHHMLEAESCSYSVRDSEFVSSCPRANDALGGEFSSLHQTTFHHYRDFWCFDISSHSWDRIDTKIRPSARSGHRWDRTDPISKVNCPAYHSQTSMTTWKHYIILFGGFYDPGSTSRPVFSWHSLFLSNLDSMLARYLNDLWVFDIQEYKWTQVEFRETDLKPSWALYIWVIWRFPIDHILGLAVDFHFCHVLKV